MAPIRSSATPARPRTNAVRSEMPDSMLKQRRRRKRLLHIVACGAVCFTASAFQAPAPPATPARELVNKYCISCHNQKLKTANLVLDNADAVHVFNSAETWEKGVVKLG